MHELIEKLIAPGVVVTDGAWGTQLQARGLEPGECPDAWNLTHADKVEEIARSYAEAGSRVIITNTFGATRLMLERHGLADRTTELNRAGAESLRTSTDPSAGQGSAWSVSIRKASRQRGSSRVARHRKPQKTQPVAMNGSKKASTPISRKPGGASPRAGRATSTRADTVSMSVVRPRHTMTSARMAGWVQKRPSMSVPARYGRTRPCSKR